MEGVLGLMELTGVFWFDAVSLVLLLRFAVLVLIFCDVRVLIFVILYGGTDSPMQVLS